MILQALSEYYQRKSLDPQTALAPFVFEEKPIPFLVVINDAGNFLQFEDTRELRGKKAVSRSFIVAQAIKKTSGVAANVLWDPADYVLGVDKKSNPERTQKQFTAFREEILKKLNLAKEDQGLRAVLLFLDAIANQNFEGDSHWSEIIETNPVLTFRLVSDACIVFNRPAVMSAYRSALRQDVKNGSTCLVTGEPDEISILHPSTKVS